MAHPASTASAPEAFVTTGAAATMLGLTAKRVSQLVDTGRLDGYRPDDGGHRRVSLAAVLARRGGIPRSGTGGDR